MLDNKRQNYHHSKLPARGEIVTLEFETPRYPGMRPAPKYMVESFNLTDSADPRYSVGIHLVNLVSLADRNLRRTVSGFWCIAAD